MDVNELLHHAGISPTVLQQTKVSLTTRQYFAIWSTIETVSNDRLIGLRIGGEAQPDQFDPATFAALHSSSFKVAHSGCTGKSALGAKADFEKIN